MLGHEVNGFGRGELRGDDKIPFIFPIFVIRQDEHTALLRLEDKLLRRGNGGIGIKFWLSCHVYAAVCYGLTGGF